MKNPIFVNIENSYLNVYNDAEDAGLSLESIDIENNVYKAFDADGRLLKIEPFQGVGKITLAEAKPTHQKELLALLKKDMSYLRSLYIIDDDLVEDLKTLVSLRHDIKKGRIPRIKHPSFFSKIKNFFKR